MANPGNQLQATDAVTGDLLWDYRRDISEDLPEKPVSCVIVTHDAATGEELWRRSLVPRPGKPGDETWGGVPDEGADARSLGPRSPLPSASSSTPRSRRLRTPSRGSTRSCSPRDGRVPVGDADRRAERHQQLGTPWSLIVSAPSWLADPVTRTTA